MRKIKIKNINQLFVSLDEKNLVPLSNILNSNFINGEIYVEKTSFL